MTKNKVLYYCIGDNIEALAELITKDNPNAKIFSEAFVTTYKRDPGDDNWEALDEFRKIKRMKNYYLHQLTEQDKNLIVFTVPNLDPVQCEYLKEQADICEYTVIVLNLQYYKPKEPLPVSTNTGSASVSSSTSGITYIWQDAWWRKKFPNTKFPWQSNPENKKPDSN